MLLQDVINWLRSIERLASSVYQAASASAASGKHSEFLKRLAEDEELHYHLMGSAAELFREQGMFPESAILIDSATKSLVETPLLALNEKINSGNVTEHDILEAVTTLESSEWNDIFLYVINSCKSNSTSFQYVASLIQAHEKRIEEYLSSVAPEKDLADKMKLLPEIWERQILVVDDEAIIRKLLERLLGRYGQVTAVENGQAALDLIKHRFFNVIVTDVDMPVLDGISFLRQAIKEDDRLRANFIVCTGRITEAVTAAGCEYGVPILQKPFSIHSIKDAVEQIFASELEGRAAKA